MKRQLTFATALLFVSFAALVSAAEPAADPKLAKVQAADDARVVAMKSPDKEKLGEVFSDDLRYAHSTGVVDSKASLTGTLTSGKTKYIGFDYEERNFSFPAPGIALMTGRVHILVTTAQGDIDSVLSFLAVWREEKGQWKFLAWQSCKLPATPQK